MNVGTVIGILCTAIHLFMYAALFQENPYNPWLLAAAWSAAYVAAVWDK